MQHRATKENTLNEKTGIQATPILIVFGVILVISGFLLIAFVTLARTPDPGFLFDYTAFGLFAAGIISIWAAWRNLS